MRLHSSCDLQKLLNTLLVKKFEMFDFQTAPNLSWYSVEKSVFHFILLLFPYSFSWFLVVVPESIQTFSLFSLLHITKCENRCILFLPFLLSFLFVFFSFFCWLSVELTSMCHFEELFSSVFYITFSFFGFLKKKRAGSNLERRFEQERDSENLKIWKIVVLLFWSIWKMILIQGIPNLFHLKIKFIDGSRIGKVLWNYSWNIKWFKSFSLE